MPTRWGCQLPRIDGIMVSVKKTTVMLAAATMAFSLSGLLGMHAASFDWAGATGDSFDWARQTASFDWAGGTDGSFDWASATASFDWAGSTGGSFDWAGDTNTTDSFDWAASEPGAATALDG